MSSATYRLGDRSLCVIPPRNSAAHSSDAGDAEYEGQISEIQRLRGHIYVKDQAIKKEALDRFGRDCTSFDYANWHIIIRDANGFLCGCIRMCFHPTAAPVNHLALHHSVARMSCNRTAIFAAAIQDFRERASTDNLLFGEVGGWAVSDEFRNTSAAVLLPIAGWALCRSVGDALILGAATSRHRSADILKRIGGFALPLTADQPSTYFDPYFGCEMELLGFDSRLPSPKYARLIDDTVALVSQMEAVAYS